MDIKIVKDLATKARDIMDKHHNDLSDVYFGNFPNGACGNTSDMLALYFSNKGLKDIAYVSGRREKQSHGWLEIKGHIVDITSDQFSDGLGTVYVGDNNVFHQSFCEQSRSDSSISNCLVGSYNKFEKLMDENV